MKKLLGCWTERLNGGKKHENRTSKRLLAFVDWSWHETAVPVFLERFILTVLAAVFMACVLNPMNFDIPQRISLATAVMAFAYFVGHTIYKDRISTATNQVAGTISSQVAEKPKSEPSTPKSIHQHFREDFSQYLSVDSAKELRAPNGVKVATADARVYFNFDASAKFVAFHIPRQHELGYSFCAQLAKACAEIADEPNKRLEARTMSPGDLAWGRSSELKFTGSVFIYYEDDFTLDQLGTLEREYKANGLNPHFRGHQYATAQWLKDQAKP